MSRLSAKVDVLLICIVGVGNIIRTLSCCYFSVESHVFYLSSSWQYVTVNALVSG